MISREKQLIAFEEKIANLFNSSKITSPIHLYYGNEKQIIKVFKNIKKMIGSFVAGDLIINAC